MWKVLAGLDLGVEDGEGQPEEVAEEERGRRKEAEDIHDGAGDGVDWA